MHKLPSILLFQAILLSLSSFATIDYLTVNHLTKELYWAQTDQGPGLIGWENVGENWLHAEKAYLTLGYTETDFPYKLEVGLLLCALIVAAVLLQFVIRGKKRNAT